MKDKNMFNHYAENFIVCGWWNSFIKILKIKNKTFPIITNLPLQQTRHNPPLLVMLSVRTKHSIQLSDQTDFCCILKSVLLCSFFCANKGIKFVIRLPFFHTFLTISQFSTFNKCFSKLLLLLWQGWMFYFHCFFEI